MSKDLDSPLDMSLLAFEDHLDFDSGFGPSTSSLRSVEGQSAYSLVAFFGPCRLTASYTRACHCCHFCVCETDPDQVIMKDSRERLIRRVCSRAAEEVQDWKHQERDWMWYAYVIVCVSLVLLLVTLLLWRQHTYILLGVMIGVLVVDSGVLIGAKMLAMHAGLKAQEELANFLHGQKFELLDSGVQPRPGYKANFIQFKYLG